MQTPISYATERAATDIQIKLQSRYRKYGENSDYANLRAQRIFSFTIAVVRRCVCLQSKCNEQLKNELHESSHKI